MKKRIIRWIRKQVKQTKAKGLAVGLSGGVDSAVVAALAKEAVGRERVLALILPCHSQARDARDARLAAKKIGIETRKLNLSDIYDSFIKNLPKSDSLARANLKPRLRMSVLYYFANHLNYLVCGTGNKSELMVGYFTKYGDGAADILPIGDLLKRQVRILAEELMIPELIINKPPTAGLWPGQTDEGEIGITYNELDDILERMERKGRQVLSIDKVKKVKRMVKRFVHKREGPKICYI